MSLVYPRHLHPMSQWVLNMAPCIYQMKGRPEYHDWGRHLIELAADQPVQIMRDVALAIASDALTTFEPWNDFLNETAKSLPWEDYALLSEHAYQAIERSPEAAFVLALLAMEGWSVIMGEGLYQQPAGLPHPGWFNLPYNCAAASLAAGGLKGAKMLVDHAYSELMASKFMYYSDPRVVNSVQQHKNLAQRIQERYEIAISNLADDLWESCALGKESFRAEFGAMCWTLGLVPESNLFRRGNPENVMPSRQLVKQVVRQSLNRIPGDPFLQYIWLEMKDRPPFSLRGHASLFAEINYRYPQIIFNDPFFEMMLPEDPATVYAQNLVAWFKGEITKARADDFMGFFMSYIDSAGPKAIHWAAYTHLGDLATLLLLEYGEPPFKGPVVNYWKSMIEYGVNGIAWQSRFPERPSLAQKANLPPFYFVEEAYDRLQDGNKDALSIQEIVDTLEAQRASSLSQWLKVIPPRVDAQERQALGELLDEEWELLTELRGTYFLILKPLLPAHYRRTASDMQFYFEEQADPEKYSRAPDNARKQYQQLEEKLHDLYQAMEARAPEYASRRLASHADLSDIAAAIRSHRE